MWNGPVLVVDLGSITFYRHGEAVSARTESGRVLGVSINPQGSDQDKIFEVLDAAAASSYVAVDPEMGGTRAKVAWYNPFTFTVTVGSVNDDDHRVFRFLEPVLLDAEGSVGVVSADSISVNGKVAHVAGVDLSLIEEQISAHA